VTFQAAIEANLALVIDRARPFADDPAPPAQKKAKLIALKPTVPVGQWRDSDLGIAFGRYAFDVNAGLAPGALEAAATLYTRFADAARAAEAERIVAHDPGEATTRGDRGVDVIPGPQLGGSARAGEPQPDPLVVRRERGDQPGLGSRARQQVHRRRSLAMKVVAEVALQDTERQHLAGRSNEPGRIGRILGVDRAGAAVVATCRDAHREQGTRSKYYSRRHRVFLLMPR
jgi:hypothetical protein